MGALTRFCVMCGDTENQPHQWVGDVAGLRRCLSDALREVLAEAVPSCDPDSGGGCPAYEALCVDPTPLPEGGGDE